MHSVGRDDKKSGNGKYMKKEHCAYIFFFLFSLALYQDLHPASHQQTSDPPDGRVIYRVGSVMGIEGSQVLVIAHNPYVDEIRIENKITYVIPKSIEVEFQEDNLLGSSRQTKSI
jgi:hypothetical protein